MAATFGPGQTATVTTDLVLASSDPSGTFGNTATVASTTDDPNAVNNTATAQVTVSPPAADLRTSQVGRHQFDRGRGDVPLPASGH